MPLHVELVRSTQPAAESIILALPPALPGEAEDRPLSNSLNDRFCVLGAQPLDARQKKDDVRNLAGCPVQLERRFADLLTTSKCENSFQNFNTLAKMSRSTYTEFE